MKKTPSRIGTFSDVEVFEIDLTQMSTQFVAAFLSRTDKPVLTLSDEQTEEVCRKSVEIAHQLMIQIQDVVEHYGEDNDNT